MYPEKRVSFAKYEVKVTHFDRSLERTISISANCTFSDFFENVKLTFTEDISGKDIRLYTFPVGFTDIGERRVLDNGNFESVLESLLAQNQGSSKCPLVYVWNYDNGSPTKMPDTEAVMGEVSSVSSSSSSSEESSITRNLQCSTACRARDGYTCLCCGHNSQATTEAAHICELESFKGTSEEERFIKLQSLALATPYDVGNMITLCKECHRYFDNHYLGIHPTESRWIVTKFLRNVTNEQGLFLLSIHSKRIRYAERWSSPTLETLEDRMSDFLKRCHCKPPCPKDNRKDGCDANDHYCHLCTELFQGVSGSAEMVAHLDASHQVQIN